MGKSKSLRCSAAKGKDPVKSNIKLGKPLTFLLSGANFGVEIMDARAQERRIIWSVLFPHVKPFQFRTKKTRWKAQGKDSAGDRRIAERNPQRGDRSISGDPPRSLQLLSSGGEILRRLEEAEIGPDQEGRQTSRGSPIV